MRILHLSGDWKWTGPAAPMLELLLAQRARGERADLACPGPPPGVHPSLLAAARAGGVEPVLQLERGRGARPWRDRLDARRLRDLLASASYDVLHTWHTRDHLLALRALTALAGSRCPRVVRSIAGAERVPAWPWNRWLFGPGAAGVLCVSPRAAARNARLRGARPIRGAFGTVDLARFAPAPPDRMLRHSLGLAPQHRVVGVVARVQARRRFDLLLEAFAELSLRDPRARLLVVGRGTRRRDVAEVPAARLGLGGAVIFAGYRSADYPDVLRCIDVLTYLVPGTDGGCRTLLEAMACGIPTVATRRGAIPEIVRDGETGILIDEQPSAVWRAWRELLQDPERRAAMGRAARARAEGRFSAQRLVREVDSLYRAAAG